VVDYKQAKDNILIGKLGFGNDILEELTSICIKEKITLGKIEAIGAVQRACVAFFNQATRKYQYINYDRPSEIINLTGNITIKEDKPFVHAHIVLADESGNAYGGHLAPGTIVFACEFIITQFSGAGLKREVDKTTGLYLWNE
jgi:predicted DNA-binding protein with PD1-like motif